MEKISVGSLEAAKMLGVSMSTLNRLAKDGLIRHWRVYGDRGYRFFAVADLKDFVQRRIDDANQIAISPQPEYVLPQLARENGHQCEGIDVSESRRCCNRGTCKKIRKDTVDAAGLSARQEETRFGQRLQGNT